MPNVQEGIPRSSSDMPLLQSLLCSSRDCVDPGVIFADAVMSLRTGAPRRGSPKVTKDRGSKVRGVVRVGDRLCGVGERLPDDAKMTPDEERRRKTMEKMIGDDERQSETTRDKAREDETKQETRRSSRRWWRGEGNLCFLSKRHSNNN